MPFLTRKYSLAVYMGVALLLAPAPYLLFTSLQTNTGGTICAWVDNPSEANWSSDGTPCRMDWLQFLLEAGAVSLLIVAAALALPFLVLGTFAAGMETVRRFRRAQ